VITYKGLCSIKLIIIYYGKGKGKCKVVLVLNQAHAIKTYWE